MWGKIKEAVSAGLFVQAIYIACVYFFFNLQFDSDIVCGLNGWLAITVPFFVVSIITFACSLNYSSSDSFNNYKF